MTDATSNRAPSQTRHIAIQMPHWGWLLLVAVVIIAGCIGLSIYLPYQRDHLVAESILAWGASVRWGTCGPDWLERLIEFDQVERLRVFDRVTGVEFDDRRCTDSELQQIGKLSNLRSLSLVGSGITDGGMVYLSGLMDLEALRLNETRLTDTGISKLKGLKSLRRLDLKWTPVSEFGVTLLRSDLPDCKINHLRMNAPPEWPTESESGPVSR